MHPLSVNTRNIPQVNKLHFISVNEETDFRIFGGRCQFGLFLGFRVKIVAVVLSSFIFFEHVGIFSPKFGERGFCLVVCNHVTPHFSGLFFRNLYRLRIGVIACPYHTPTTVFFQVVKHHVNNRVVNVGVFHEFKTAVVIVSVNIADNGFLVILKDNTFIILSHFVVLLKVKLRYDSIYAKTVPKITFC